MIRDGAGQRLGRELHLDRPDLPGVRAARDAGPVDLRVRHMTGRPAAGWSARNLRSECHHAWPCGPGRDRRPATAGRPAQRGCAPAGPATAAGREPEPGRGHPVPGQPAPGRARAEPAGGRVPGAPPPGRDRGQPGLLDAQRGGQQVGRARRSAHRRAGARRCPAGTGGPFRHPRGGRARNGRVVVSVVVSWACAVMPMRLPSPLSQPPPMPCVVRYARDVTIVRSCFLTRRKLLCP